MSITAQNLLILSQMRNEARKMENFDFKSVDSSNHISQDIKISRAMIHTAQGTLTDLDKSIMELAELVNCLKSNSIALKDMV